MWAFYKKLNLHWVGIVYGWKLMFIWREQTGLKYDKQFTIFLSFSKVRVFSVFTLLN